jgi:hypothetical protein
MPLTDAEIRKLANEFSQLVQILNRISQDLHQIRDALHRIATDQVRPVPRR